MKILHLIKATRLSGAERHLLILLPALRALHIDAHLVLLVEADKPMDNIVQECASLGIPCQRITIKRGLDLRVIADMVRVFRAEKPDMVHTHLIHADVLGLISATIARIPCVITTRHNDDDFRHRRVIRWLSAWQWSQVQGGIAISQHIAQFARKIEKAPADKIHMIHYGLPHQRPDPSTIEANRHTLRAELGLSPDALLVGVASRLTAQKGISFALEALPALMREFADLHVVIAGDGELRAGLRARTMALGIDKRVHFLGWRNDMPQVLQALDVFLMPSLWEGFGLTLLEAMSARLPIVASHVSAIPEIVVHGETGYLVAPEDSEAIAYALRLLLQDKSLRQYMGFNGEDRLESQFNVSKMSEKTLSLYRRVKK
jgi:glycosyltransferase involved in cell wall biosynthesis